MVSTTTGHRAAHLYAVYAIDFLMPIGSTVTSVRVGTVHDVH